VSFEFCEVFVFIAFESAFAFTHSCIKGHVVLGHPSLNDIKVLIKNTPGSGVSRDQPEPGSLLATWVRPGADVKTLACEVVETSAIARVQ
jgi:hypothetical protein